MEQTTIFEQLERIHSRLSDSCQKAIDFHYDNPHYYRLFRRFANEASNAGAKNFGAAAVTERMRWYSAIEKPMDEEYKVNNNLRALYARLFDYERRLRGQDPFFRVRDSGFDDLNDMQLRMMIAAIVAG